MAGVTGAIGSAAGSVSKIVKDKIKPKANVKIADDVADGMNSMTTKASNSAKKTTGKADILPENKISSAMSSTGNADVVKKQMAGSGGTDSSGQAFKMDLQLFSDKGDKGLSTKLTLEEALSELDKTGLRPGQDVISRKQLNETLDAISNNYNPTKAYSSVYSDGINRYLVEGHHTTVAFKMLGKHSGLNMNISTSDIPSATNVYWTKKWHQFWKKSIKIID